MRLVHDFSAFDTVSEQENTLFQDTFSGKSPDNKVLEVHPASYLFNPERTEYLAGKLGMDLKVCTVQDFAREVLPGDTFIVCDGTEQPWFGSYEPTTCQSLKLAGGSFPHCMVRPTIQDSDGVVHMRGLRANAPIVLCDDPELRRELGCKS